MVLGFHHYAEASYKFIGKVTDQVFSESEEWDIDTVSETIASEYERATNLSINKEKQNLPIEEKTNDRC